MGGASAWILRYDHVSPAKPCLRSLCFLGAGQRGRPNQATGTGHGHQEQDTGSKTAEVVKPGASFVALIIRQNRYPEANTGWSWQSALRK